VVIADAPTPSLAIVDRAPIVLRGAGFRNGESVRITATGGLGPVVVTTTAVGGTFRVSLKLLQGPCGGPTTLRARGNRGSVATATLRGSICVPPPLD